MPIPLPGGMADELMWHMRNCPTCKSAKVRNSPDYCERGLQLIKLTLNERHGTL